MDSSNTSSLDLNFSSEALANMSRNNTGTGMMIGLDLEVYW